MSIEFDIRVLDHLPPLDPLGANESRGLAHRTTSGLRSD